MRSNQDPNPTSPSLPLPPKQARGAKRVEALLDAAASLVAEQGPTGFSFREVAKRARTAHGSLYQFFPSREAILIALHMRYAERAVDLAEQVVADAERKPDWAAALGSSVVSHFLPFYRDSPGYGAIRRWAAATGASEVEDQVDAHIVARLSPALVACGIPETRAPRVAQVVIEIADALLPLAAEDGSWAEEAECAIAGYLKHCSDRGG